MIDPNNISITFSSNEILIITLLSQLGAAAMAEDDEYAATVERLISQFVDPIKYADSATNKMSAAMQAAGTLILPVKRGDIS